MVIAQLIFWIPLVALIYSYLVYPVLLNVLSRNKEPNKTIYTYDELPALSILIAAHNEEHVIEEKLRSIFNGHYPGEKLEVFVGSDASTDKTNGIVENLCKEYSN